MSSLFIRSLQFTQNKKIRIVQVRFYSSEMPCKPLRISTSELEPCGSHHGYDYFAGSEVTYIIIWTCFGLIPLGKYVLNCKICVMFRFVFLMTSAFFILLLKAINFYFHRHWNTFAWMFFIFIKICNAMYSIRKKSYSRIIFLFVSEVYSEHFYYYK